MAEALYRRFRPKRFRDVIGQGDAVQALCNQVAAGKTGHAYLLTGIRGTGKTTLARILAKAVNCPNMDAGEPCCVCDICLGIDNGSILDITEIDAASNNGVDNIRDLRDDSAYTPVMTEKRVYIIDEAHMLSPGASNALLKVLEEPPEHVMFILATTEIHRLPATILSRCQRFDMKRISTADIAGVLMSIAEEAGFVLEKEAAELIARLSDGSMRDALSILDTCTSTGSVIGPEVVRRFTGAIENEPLFALADCIAENDLCGALKQIDSVYTGSINPAILVSGFMSHLRNLLLMSVGGIEVLKDIQKDELLRYTEQSGRFSRGRLIGILKNLKILAGALPSVVDKRLQLELCIIELCSGEGEQVVFPKREETRKTAQAPKADPKDISKGRTRADDAVPLPDPQEDTPKIDKSGAGGQKTISRTIEDRDPQEGPKETVIFAEWPKVIEAMKQRNGMLYGFMQGSDAYLSPTHVLIDCAETFKAQLREKKEYADIVKEVIADTTGVRLPIGPYAGEGEKSGSKSDEELERIIKFAEQHEIPLISG